MIRFQDIALGLLHFTNPETFISMSRQNAIAARTAASVAAVATVIEPNDSIAGRSAGRATGLVRALKFAFAALAAGSRVVPLGDNSQLVRDLAARAASIYGKSGGRDTRVGAC
jgi:hypothetical protein